MGGLAVTLFGTYTYICRLDGLLPKFDTWTSDAALADGAAWRSVNAVSAATPTAISALSHLFIACSPLSHRGFRNFLNDRWRQRVAAASGTDRRYVVMDLATCGSVEGETGRVSVAAGPGALEAVRDAGAWRDGAVIAGVGEGRVLTGLGVATVEVAGDLLVAWEGEGQRPSVDRGRPGVGDDHLRGEATGPFTALGVGDVAGAAAAAPADVPGEAGSASGTRGVPDGDGDGVVARRCGRAGDEAGGGVDRQPGGQAGRGVGQGLSRRRVGGLDLEAGSGADGPGPGAWVGHRHRALATAGCGECVLHRGEGELGVVVLVEHGGGALAGERAGDPGVGVPDGPLGHAHAAGDAQAVLDHVGEVGGLLGEVGAGGRERDAVVKLGDRDIQAEVRELLHVRLHVGRDLAEDEVALENTTVHRHALRQQRLREAVHRVALGVHALDSVVVQVQLRVRVGSVRGPQRVGDVAAAHRVVERVRHERPVTVERLVDHVPRVALALVVGGLRGDVGLHRRLHLASRQGGHPRGELALPDQVVTAHPLAVRLGIGDDLVARAEVERAVGRLCGVPLYLVARRDHVELLGLELGHR